MPFPDNKEDLQVFVDDLTEQMERRFARMNTSIMSQLDQMGRRVDDLERDLHSLASQAGLEAPPSRRRRGKEEESSLSTSSSAPLSPSSPTSAASGAVEI
mmetsp:Transcript_22651/g.42989  ORF Transcript_22651/g.42989 Transcript_22651/m.42989 type:complete len:100 (+) Transcript_22651:124-423(+)